MLWVVLWLARVVSAWWDEGHMLVAAVAELALTYDLPSRPWASRQWSPTEGHETLDTINALLSGWRRQYPAYTDLVSAAVWADHIKCVQPSSFCSGGLDGIEIFNAHHFVDIEARAPHYNQSDQDLQLNQKAYTADNAVWLLNQIARSLSRVLALHQASPLDPATLFTIDIEKTYEHILSHPESLTKAPGSIGMPPVFGRKAANRTANLNRHELLGGSSGVTPSALLTQHGTLFSYNLLLRLFIHVMGDIHQPLHTVNRIDAHCFPHGDRGGNSIFVEFDANPGLFKQPNAVMPETYHQFWDSAGGRFVHSYPEFTVNQARVKARDLVAKYSSILGQTQFDPNITRIVRDSGRVAREVAFVPLDTLTFCPTRRRPFKASQTLVEQVQTHAETQIVQGGLNLAAFLRLFVREVPQQMRTYTDDLEALEESLASWQITAFILGAVSSALGAYAVVTLLRGRPPARRKSFIGEESRLIVSQDGYMPLLGVDKRGD